MKYKITDAGYEAAAKLNKHAAPCIRNKILVLLSARMSYTQDSIISNVLLDPRLKAREGHVVGEITALKILGYIEEVV